MGTIRGSVFEQDQEGGREKRISGVKIEFWRDRRMVEEVESDRGGTYGVELPAGRYRLKATHPSYVDYSTSPGVIAVDETGVQTFDISMKRRVPAEPSGPTITDFSPRSGFGGTKLTIHGTGFSPHRLENEVSVGNQPAHVMTADPTELVVLVANDAETGPVEVTIRDTTRTGPHDFRVVEYPDPKTESDGPPIHYMGAASAGGAGKFPTKGNLDVLVSLVHPSDKTPANTTTERNDVVNLWDDIETFYDQASFGKLSVNTTVTSNWHKLSGNYSTYILETGKWWAPNVRQSVTGRLYAEAAKAAEDDGHDLDDFDALAVIIYLDGKFIRAWNSGFTNNFSYNGSGLNINITTSNDVNQIVLGETATWGRCAHELGHGLIDAPSGLKSSDGVQVQREDVYQSDLIDPSVATADQFEMMGNHDGYPLFSSFYMEQLEWYDPNNQAHVRTTPDWSRNKFSKEFDVVAHGTTANTAADRTHVVRIPVTSGLDYYIEARQRPGTTQQIFDPNIPLNGAPNDGGVVVTKVLTDKVNMNQQMRFITLLHDKQVLSAGETAVDPARNLTIEVVNDSVQTRPLVSRVRVTWNEDPTPDSAGKFDLYLEPWDERYQTPDIWIDRKPSGVFDKPKDAAGRPTGSGDKPRPNEINRFTGRVHNTGTEQSEDVKLTFYSVYPPGVGDNGNWGPLGTVEVADIDANDYEDVWVNWVPIVGRHTCLRVYTGEQEGEVTFGNNQAQENVFEFEAPASSIPQPVTMSTAVRNPLDQRTIVYLDIRNVPEGYTVHFPHQWVWLNPREERQFDLTIVPTEDYGWYTDIHHKDMDAPITLVGGVPRHYTEANPSGTVPPSWISPIGGITAIVRPKRVVELELEVEQTEPEETILVGRMIPAMPDEPVSVAADDPFDRRRVAETTTDANGRFHVTMDFTRPGEPDDERLPADEYVGGSYRAQAFTFNAPTAAETESNVVFFELPDVAVPDGGDASDTESDEV